MCPDSIRQLEDDVFVVNSSSRSGVEYTVHMSVESCDCEAMLMRRYCKHIISVHHLFYVGLSETSLQCQTAFRNTVFELATGKKPPAGWLTGLHEVAGLTAASSSSTTSAQDHAAAESVVVGLEVRDAGTRQTDTADVLTQLDAWHQKMTALVTENPDEFVPAAHKFMDSFNNLHAKCNRSELVSALHNFGKMSGVYKFMLGSVCAPCCVVHCIVVAIVLFFSARQEIGQEEHRQNDLFLVE